MRERYRYVGTGNAIESDTVKSGAWQYSDLNKPATHELDTYPYKLIYIIIQSLTLCITFFTVLFSNIIKHPSPTYLILSLITSKLTLIPFLAFISIKLSSQCIEYNLLIDIITYLGVFIYSIVVPMVTMIFFIVVWRTWY